VLDLVLHLDVHLLRMVAEYGAWIYAILFAIIFCETGLVVTPFLPGDSLLFVAGAIAAAGQLDVNGLFVLLAVAAFLGNSVNYTIGRWMGRHFFVDRGSRWLNPDHLRRAHDFYGRHGGSAVILSRFMPIIRTYVPFVAGLGAMNPRRYMTYNAVGAVLWVGGLTYAGYFFGNVPWVKGNLTFIILGIVAVSLIPVAWALLTKPREA
jgi:membrane-associated protein